MSSGEHERARAVRVLVAQAADPPARLSGLLEDAGHRVVARAATPDELARLARIARPEVVVFDAEISAETVAAFRDEQPTVGVVVVWPEGATAASAHERVSPVRVRQDLARAVHRAAPVRPAPVAVESGPRATALHLTQPAGRLGRGGVEIAVAAALTFLLVLSAVALRRADEEGGGARTGIIVAAASPSASEPATRVALPPPGPASGADTGSTTGTAGELRTPVAVPGDTGSTTTTGEPGPVVPPTVDPTRIARVPDGSATTTQPSTGSTLLARERTCRSSTARLGVVRAGPALQRLVARCVATDAAGLLRALARLVHREGSSPGGGSGRPAPHRGGPGDAPDRASSRHHGQGRPPHHDRHGASHHQGPPRPGHPAHGHGPHPRPPRHGVVAGHRNAPQGG